MSFRQDGLSNLWAAICRNGYVIEEASYEGDTRANPTSILSEWSVRFVLLVLLGVHTTLLAWGAYVHSPTLNEPGHLVAGISNWQFGRLDIYKVNPPLVRMVTALPVLAAGVRTDWHNFYDAPGARPEGILGEDFIAANGERSFWLMTLARWACIPFSLLGGYLCFRWARELYGISAGLLAATLWCFGPTILAHGQLITSDVPAASLGLMACYTFWRWLRQPTWWHTLFSGLALGGAELAKTTLVVFDLLWPLLWLIFRWPDRHKLYARDWARELGMLIARMIIGVCVINIGYAFEGSGTRLGDFCFVSGTLSAQEHVEQGLNKGGNRFSQTWLGAMPIPLPKNYVLGIDLQKRDFEECAQPSYLRNEFSFKGWWYYYLYALTIKVPLGMLLLLGLAIVMRIWANANVQLRDEFIVLAPAVIILIFVSSQTGLNQHMRYVLPAFPFAFVWISRLAVVFNRKHWCLTGVVMMAMAWSIISSLSTYPHSLSFFNELVGGPCGGPSHLISSNVDWGQDLLILKRWLDDHPEARPLKLAYFGFFDPCHAGIEYTAPDDTLIENQSGGTQIQISPGWYAISVNFVRGSPYFLYKGDGSKRLLNQNALAGFQHFQPIAMAGYSIYIYHITTTKAN